MPDIDKQPRYLSESWKNKCHDDLKTILQDFLDQCEGLNNGYTRDNAIMTIDEMKNKLQTIIDGVEWALSEGHIVPNPKKKIPVSYGPSCDVLSHTKGELLL